MDYVPEWKIYLWKKLILNKAGEFDGPLKPGNFVFFTEAEQREAFRQIAQKSVDSVNMAVRAGSVMDIGGEHIPLEDTYFHSEPKDAVAGLIELTGADPKLLTVENIVLQKTYLAAYKRNRGEYLAMEEKKRVASISMGSAGRKPSESYFNDKHAGLGPTIHAKVEACQELAVSELQSLLGTGLPIFDFLSFAIKIDKAKLEAKFNAYIDDFVANKLLAPKGVRYFDPERQIANISAALGRLSQKYGKNMTITAEEVAKAGGWYIRDEHHYRFYESIFALEKSGQIEISGLRKDEVMISLKNQPQKDMPVQSVSEPVAPKVPSVKSEIAIGKLVGYNDGSIRYDGKMLTLRPQIKDLCWLFMRRHNQLVNATDIKEEIVKAARRKNTSVDTISKYVSELQKELKIHFGKSVITNEPKGGWIFNP